MNDSAKVNAIPPAIPIHSNWEEAISFFEQAQRAGKASPETLYLLAMCHKRLGKINDARAALRQIKNPDANVLLQLGLLAFAENQYAEAEKEFTDALQLDPNFYAANYNLFLTQLFLGKLSLSSEALAKLADQATDSEEKQFLTAMTALVKSADPEPPGTNPGRFDGTNGVKKEESLAVLLAMSDDVENRILELLKGAGNLNTTYPLFRALARTRTRSVNAQRIYLEVILLQAKTAFDRCQWDDTDKLLAPLARLMEAVGATPSSIPFPIRLAFLNLEGCTACMRQDYDKAIHCFSAAIKLAGHDAWLYQNLAITFELMGRLDQADVHWTRYFDLLNTQTPSPPIPNYLETLAYTSLHRLGDTYSRLEKWGSALNYMQRAHRLRPRDNDTLERLFTLYVQIRRPEDARRMLHRMRELRPADPQLDLYELDLREVRSLEDMDRMLADVKRILAKYPGEPRVEEKAFHLVANFVPLISRKAEQLTQKLAQIVDQVRSLPNYKINWPIVHDEMSIMRQEFQNLRKIANKCLAAVNQEEHRHVIRDLIAHIESRIDICISMGG
jgi:Flp pilus assembly protein TadD